MAAGPLPLQGIKVLEFAGLAPGPYAGMLLADAGASVLRVDRATKHPNPSPTPDILARGKASIAVDLKDPRGVALLRKLLRGVDVLIDPFRPGVLEKLGLGPDVVLADNPRLVYARMAGFRRDGRYAHMAGHDINYLAVSGVLAMLGRAGEKPHAPWNLLADFAGGGAVLVQGILLALLARQGSGSGQVVEANMVDGSSYLATFARVARRTHVGGGPRGQNLLDGGAPFYDTYETRDGRHVAVGSIEPAFFAALLAGLGLAGQGWEARQQDRGSWPALRRLLEETFRGRTRAEWEAVFDGTDACCTPVLTYEELESGGGGEGREGEQRPLVTLRATPLREEKGEGAGYAPCVLRPGEGGEAVLREWLGWEAGRDFQVREGGLVSAGKAKL
ncbi:CoA-transferase family III domain-containing protein [Stachybotrys elegans]|uniref:CoA-transferase family III domain-containing protein n=1 Tax=Stachybotrys elegans TaxID=80388 RepID=A0A8K0SPE9_9HYPO|nr:CoA-transferase family III domain-containing protein [Stachybotrys elegans]